MLAVTKWKYYLVGNHYEVYTDHESLKHLWEQDISTSQAQGSWLMGYNFSIIYKQGKEKRVGDSLSRQQELYLLPVSKEGRSSPLCLTIPQWIETIKMD